MGAPAVDTAADLLPDLGMDELRDFSVEAASGGRRLLRFTSKIVNVGVGPFELRGSRPDTTNPALTTASSASATCTAAVARWPPQPR